MKVANDLLARKVLHAAGQCCSRPSVGPYRPHSALLPTSSSIRLLPLSPVQDITVIEDALRAYDDIIKLYGDKLAPHAACGLRIGAVHGGAVARAHGARGGRAWRCGG